LYDAHLYELPIIQAASHSFGETLQPARKTGSRQEVKGLQTLQFCEGGGKLKLEALAGDLHWTLEVYSASVVNNRRGLCLLTVKY